MKPEKWAATLSYEQQEKLESRVAKIVEYLAKNNQQSQWVISDIDATGGCGDKLTSYFNDAGIVRLSSEELLDVLREDGQVIELEVTLVQADRKLCKIFVRDGVSIDVLGIGDIPPLTILGRYTPVDINFFMWQDKETLPLEQEGATPA